MANLAQIAGLYTYLLLGIEDPSTAAVADLSDPENSTAGDSWLGLGPPVVIGIGFLLMGPVLTLLWRCSGHPEFFRRRREVAAPGLLEPAAETR